MEESCFPQTGPGRTPRHVAMRHDRPSGEERRDRGRTGRGEIGSRRSISPRGSRHGDRDRDTDHGRYDRIAKPEPSAKHTYSTRDRSRDRSGYSSRRHQDRDREPNSSSRRSESRRVVQDAIREVTPRQPAPVPVPGGADRDRPSSRKRHRSPSSPSAPSHRKKSKPHRSRNVDDKRARDNLEEPRPSHSRRRSRDRRPSPNRHPKHKGGAGRESGASTRRERHGDDHEPLPSEQHPSFGTEHAYHDSRDSLAGLASPGSRTSPSHIDPNPSSRASSPSRVSSGHPGRRRSPRGARRPRKGRTRGSGDGPSGTGANSIEVNMSARGGSFRGGHAPGPHGSFPQKSQYGSDHRGNNYSQSPTPNPSYHNSPASQSSYPSGRSGWNGQQQYPQSPQQYPPQYPSSGYGPPSGPPSGPPTGPQGHYYPNSSHSPPHSAPTGPMSQYQGNYRGGYRGNSGSYRGNQFGPNRGGYRAPGFKPAQWNSAGQGGQGGPPGNRPATGSSAQEPSPQETNTSRTQPDTPNTTTSQKDEKQYNKPSRPPKEPKAETAGADARTDTSKTGNAGNAATQNGEATGETPNRQPPAGPASSKFSFAFKTSAKHTPTAPKPEISQKFNAVPQKQAPPPTAPQAPSQSSSAPKDRERRDRDFPRSVPTEPASARAARRNMEAAAAAAPRAPRMRKVKKKMRRPVERPKLESNFANSKSIFYRKPGNESVVGSGTYGKVFKGLNVYTKDAVALKRIRMEGEKDGFPVTATREVKLLQSLRHVNIVELIEVMVEKNDCFMVFEYLAHDLTGILNHPTFKLEDAQRKHLSKQLFEGLDYLHVRGVLHRDIKAANILVSKEGILKLADFGLARFYAKRHQLDYTNRVVTIWYRSPELLLGETQYGPACDVWSAACVMMEIFVRSAVFPGDGTEMNQLERIYSVLGTPTKSQWPGIVDMAWFQLLRPNHKIRSVFAERYEAKLSPAAFELVSSMFEYDPAKRPTASQILAHAYFTTEEPRPQQAVVLKDIDGDWHEFESKALRRENERKEKEARKAKETQNAKDRDRDRDRDRKRPNDGADDPRETKRLHMEDTETSKA